MRVHRLGCRQGCPYPEYSTDFEAMVALVERLRRPERGEVADARA